MFDLGGGCSGYGGVFGGYGQVSSGYGWSFKIAGMSLHFGCFTVPNGYASTLQPQVYFVFDGLPGQLLDGSLRPH